MTIAPAAHGGASPTAPKSTGGYIVLKQMKPKDAVFDVTTLGGWEIVAKNIAASSAASAIRKCAEDDGRPDGLMAGVVLVAVPVKSWKPQKITANTVTKLVVEDVKP